MTERPRQSNCQLEPPYPAHATALCSLRDPDLTSHQPFLRCNTQYPHAIAECGEFNAAFTGAAT